MKPHARRISIGAAALVAAITAVFVVANWSIVRDHFAAWHFQLTRETETIKAPAEGTTTYADRVEEHFLHIAAHQLRCSVIFDPLDVPRPRFLGKVRRDVVRRLLEKSEYLERNGYRLLEHRFPRRAYVVIRER
jgi:hypothetical protein